MKLFQKIWTEEEGQGLTEYALIIAFVAILLVSAIKGFGNNLVNAYANIVAAF